MPVIMPFAFLIFKLGIIGTDTSHAGEFTKLLNGGTVTRGRRLSPLTKEAVRTWEIEPNTRVDKYAKDLKTKWGVEIVNDIPTLASKVDGILLLSVDGRVHLPQFKAVLSAKKPVFIDKPLASTLADAREISRLAKEANVPWFSASSLRYSEIVSSVEGPGILGAMSWGPGPFEEHHQLDLSWYTIHEIEILFTLMGPGCEEVTRVSGGDADEITCRWKDGRLGTVRALRPYGIYGAVVFRKDGVQVSPAKPHTDYEGLVREIVKFFETGRAPVSNADTLGIFEFMDAAQRSKEAGGKPMQVR